MVGLVDSFKKFAIILASLTIIGFGTVYLFDLLSATSINLFIFSRESLRVIIIVGFWLLILLFIRHSKPFMSARIGSQATTILQLLLEAVAALVMFLGILHTLGVPAESLLAGAGIVSITIGLIVSTFVGSILSGVFVFATNNFRVGDYILVNNIPGEILEMTPLVTKIRTDVGQISIPNSAIASGSVIIVAVHKHEPKSLSRLPYALGDKVVSTYINEEGVVKELTPLHTVIKLKSGKELTFLNNSVLSGAVAVAKISESKEKTE